MNVAYMPPIDHHGPFSKKRMHLRPMLPIPINYETAAVPTFAPFGTEYTPDYTVRIIGGRRISIPNSLTSAPKPPVRTATKTRDPALAPSKALQNVHAFDNSQWQQQSRARFDTTYRTEYINRIRHPEYTPWYQQTHSDNIAKSQRKTNSSFNQYSILPPIGPHSTSIDKFRSTGSARNAFPDLPRSNKDQETKPNDVPPLNFNNGNQNFYEPANQPDPSMMNNDDTYLPEEPVLLTDYEEERLIEQIRTQLGQSITVDRLKLFYQELTAYDPNVTSYVHYSNIQLVASQLGLNLQDDTFRFAMCKFVSPERGRGFVNYEDMVRYFGKCLSSMSSNSYGSRQYQGGRFWSLHSIYHDLYTQGQQRNLSPKKNGYDYGYSNTQNGNPIRMRLGGSSIVNNDEHEHFDPDERQMRVLLKQNLKFFDLNGTIDFDKLSRELTLADRNQNGVLNRQQIEEVVYKVRIPLQRSLIFQILEKHCRAYSRLYKWEAFVQYLKEQILDLKEVQDRSSPTRTQQSPSRNQWIELMRREYLEKDRLKVIERYIKNNEGIRIESNHPTAWFTRYLRLVNAMYGHRTSTNREQDFVLPREEARRLFRAYNHVWDLKFDEDRLQRVLDACGRNGNTGIDDALKLFAKQT